MITKSKTIDKFHVWTVGCQMNIADSQRVDVGLKRLGLDEEKNIEEADIIVLNTCVVRQSAEDTATGLLGKLAKQKRKKSTYICVTGCMVESTTKSLAQRFPHVDLWAKPQDTPKIIENIADYLNLSSDGCVENLIPEKSKFAEFVPIVQGCDKFCTFCVIPYRRGRETSKPTNQLFEEIKTLVDNGTKEVTLLGQNVDSYGHDLNPKKDLSNLNQQLIGLEKSFISDKGMYFGSWYRSLYASSDPFSGYAAWILPGLEYEIALKASNRLEEWDSRYSEAINSLNLKMNELINDLN